MPEKRAFRVHHKLLYDVIFRQAGTLAKAILEGVMNAIDAKSKTCRIHITENTVTIKDDGVGFKTRKQIVEWFEQFGMPHEDNEQKVFGTFRMGRGQLFAYGVNDWRTGPFQMKVDAKNVGLDYELDKLPEKQPGCHISVQLYTPLMPSGVAETNRLVEQWVKYVGLNKTKIFLNDKLVSKDPAEEKWDFTTPEAYIRLNTTGSMSLYNLGVHTMELPQYRFGSGGFIVSRQQLKVNFARTDVDDTCPVWQAIKPFVQKEADRNIAKKSSLTDGERQRVADRLISGDIKFSELDKLRIFTNVAGRQLTFRQLRSFACGYKVTSCERDNPLGDKINQYKLAIVLSDETLERFRVDTVEELVEFLNAKLPNHWQSAKLVAVDFDVLAQDFKKDYKILAEEELTDTQKLWRQVAQRSVYHLLLHGLDMEENRVLHRRRILIGHGPADGWTDGRTYIAIADQFLSRLEFDISGFGRLGDLLLHEMCHNEASNGTHTHDSDFYQQFHDSAGTIGDFINDCLIKLPRIVEDMNKKQTRRMLAVQDRKVKAEQAKLVAV